MLDIYSSNKSSTFIAQHQALREIWEATYGPLAESTHYFADRKNKFVTATTRVDDKMPHSLDDRLAAVFFVHVEKKGRPVQLPMNAKEIGKLLEAVKAGHEDFADFTEYELALFRRQLVRAQNSLESWGKYLSEAETEIGQRTKSTRKSAGTFTPEVTAA